MRTHRFHDAFVVTLVGVAVIDASHFVVVAVIEDAIHRIATKPQAGDGGTARAPQIMRRHLVAFSKTNGRAHIAHYIVKPTNRIALCALKYKAFTLKVDHLTYRLH